MFFLSPNWFDGLYCVWRERERGREREPSPVNSDTITCFIVDINISSIAFVDKNCWSREAVIYGKHCLVATKPFKKCVFHLQPKCKIFKSNTIRWKKIYRKGFNHILQVPYQYRPLLMGGFTWKNKNNQHFSIINI